MHLYKLTGVPRARGEFVTRSNAGPEGIQALRGTVIILCFCRACAGQTHCSGSFTWEIMVQGSSDPGPVRRSGMGPDRSSPGRQMPPVTSRDLAPLCFSPLMGIFENSRKPYSQCWDRARRCLSVMRGIDISCLSLKERAIYLR